MGNRFTFTSEPFSLKTDGASPGVQAGADGKKTKRRITIVANSGMPMRLKGFDAPVIVDFDTLDTSRQAVPVVMDHQLNQDSLVGQTDSVGVKLGKLLAEGWVFLVDSSTQARRTVQLADAGFNWQASIGADAKQYDYIGRNESVGVNGQLWDGPLYVARGTRVSEISVLISGADDGTSVSIAASRNPTVVDGVGLSAGTVGLTADEARELHALRAGNDDELREIYAGRLGLTVDEYREFNSLRSPNHHFLPH